MNLCDSCEKTQCHVIPAVWCSVYKPKEKEMEKQKFQFESEEQARDIIDDLDWNPDCIKDLIDKGYIRKSELQILVDEAEEMIDLYKNKSGAEFKEKYNDFIFGQTLSNVFQALKKSHPEFKK